MKRLLWMLVVSLFLLSPAYAADFYQDKSTKEWKINFENDKETVIVVIGKTKLRLHKCGQVDVMKWDQVVANPEGNTTAYGIWSGPTIEYDPRSGTYRTK